MENKINIAELLKDCPKGMELDCTMYDSVTLLNVNDREDITFPIKVLREDGNYIPLTKYGQYTYADFAKCIIFPKGKTNWEDFVPPCEFKAGDIIKHKESGLYCTLGEYAEGISAYRTNIGLSLTYKELEQWELVPTKFDINTLKPFDKVLVRDNNEQFWTCDWFSFHDTKQVYPFACVGHYVSQCIPYEGNQHLLGTTNDCDEFYKNWE